MGLGNHKTLDYLSISLNLPLSYNPHFLSSSHYSKVLHDMLMHKHHFNDYHKKEESQRVVLRLLLQQCFINNKLYKSDFNDTYFEKQNGVTNFVSQETIYGS